MGNTIGKVRLALETVLDIYGPPRGTDVSYPGGHPIALCFDSLTRIGEDPDEKTVPLANTALAAALDRFVMIQKTITPPSHPVMRIWEGFEATEGWMKRHASFNVMRQIEPSDLLDLMLATNAWIATIYRRPLDSSIASASCVERAIRSLEVMGERSDTETDEALAERLTEAIWRLDHPAERAADVWPDDVHGGSENLLRGQTSIFLNILSTMRQPHQVSATERFVRTKLLLPISIEEDGKGDEKRAAIAMLLQAAGMSDLLENAPQNAGPFPDGP